MKHHCVFHSRSTNCNARNFINMTNIKSFKYFELLEALRFVESKIQEVLYLQILNIYSLICYPAKHKFLNINILHNFVIFENHNFI